MQGPDSDDSKLVEVAQLPLNICWGDRWWQVC